MLDQTIWLRRRGVPSERWHAQTVIEKTELVRAACGATFHKNLIHTIGTEPPFEVRCASCDIARLAAR